MISMVRHPGNPPKRGKREGEKKKKEVIDFLIGNVI